MLPAVTVDTYNEELRDEEGFVGDRASRRPSSVSAALSCSGLPLVPQRTTHPRSTARNMDVRDSYILGNVAHRIGCPAVASKSL
jgi:hypothetical protein